MEKCMTGNDYKTREYHDTFLLLNKYRDVVWSLETSTGKLKSKFMREMGCSLEDYLDNTYVAGMEFSKSGVQEHTKILESSRQMLMLLESAVDVLRRKHKYGETYYWILYYSFLSPKQYRNTEEILEQLMLHIDSVSYRTYFRKRREAVDALSTVLWGYATKDSMDILYRFVS